MAITSAGGARLAQAKPAWQTAQERFAGSLGADDSATLRKLLAAANAAKF